MYCKVFCGTLIGIQGKIIDVEVDVSDGFPTLNIVGMPSSTIKEAKERVRTGIKNSGYHFPYKRVTINLAPAHIKKEGVAFDLAIALGILCCNHGVKSHVFSQSLFVGELALNGEVRPVKGVLALVDAAKALGLKQCFVPELNIKEALLVEGIQVFGIRCLSQLVQFLNGDHSQIKQSNRNEFVLLKHRKSNLDFSQVVGQLKAKRGLEIAVSGMHHVMMIGPPGIGKSMLAKRIKTILPPLEREEILELTRIYSAAEKLLHQDEVVSERPFREPHHSITRASFIGGGINKKPGEISLAHHGVLMLDEFPEFGRNVIESLREPLECGEILLSRNQECFSFPAEFMLVAAMNPCPCGHYPNPYKCKCLPSDIDKYQGKISGPVQSRIDIFIEMNPESYSQIVSKEQSDNSKMILERVQRVHQFQKERYAKDNLSFNAQLGVDEIKKYCQTDNKAKKLLQQAFDKLHLSSRSYHRLLKVARTIADMEQSELILAKHVAEAVQFRSQT